jgi:Domain of unknown function (DUF4926)
MTKMETAAMIKELDPVVLTKGLPEHGLQAGDVGCVVMVHAGGAGYEVEIVTLDGETVLVETLSAGAVLDLGHDGPESSASAGNATSVSSEVRSQPAQTSPAYACSSLCRRTQLILL